jgi:hypothetical protein
MPPRVKALRNNPLQQLSVFISDHPDRGNVIFDNVFPLFIARVLPCVDVGKVLSAGISRFIFCAEVPDGKIFLTTGKIW